MVLGCQVVSWCTACGHSRAVWFAGDVTAPSDPNIGEMVSIAYGFFPYVLGLVCLVEVVPLMRLVLVG